MKNPLMFTENKEAVREMLIVLMGNDWQKSFLTNPEGEIKELYKDKEEVRWFNDVAPCGNFNSKEEAEQTLHDCLILMLDEIAEWLINGKGATLKLRYEFDEPVGYCFDRDGNEHVNGKLQLCLRRDRRHNTDFDFFVSYFHPVYEYIE